MHEILGILRPGGYVLDLGSRSGSFAGEGLPCPTVCVDAEVPGSHPRLFVAARAEALPFRDGQFAAVISNHSLEHFEALQQALDEIGRVVARDGFVYVAVPDSSTVTDRIYRWLGRGGGHVNSFTSAPALSRLLCEKTGLPPAGTRVLCTSLSFLNRANIPGKRQKLLWLFGGGSERVLRSLTYTFRLLDRFLQTRTCVYGWAFYFGSGLQVETATWTNVCVRCGSAHPSSRLRKEGFVAGNVVRCPQCGTKNYFTPDEKFTFLR
ncbi:MAG TPA: class I SAM-dependent methyltransferase [Bryobacteraceae bacterium]